MPLIEWNGRLIDRDAQLRELDRADAEESLHFFLKKAWKYIDPAPFTDGWVIEALAEHLEAVADGDIKRLLINIPPRHSKSSICSVAFPAWIWAQEYESPTSGPGVPIVSGSYAFKLSVRDSVKCRRLIASPWYQQLWGHRFSLLSDSNQKIRFGNTRGGERIVTAVDGGITGEGGNIIIIDDPNNAKEVLSEATIEATNEDWWDGTMSTRLNDPKTGAYIVIQQRLGESDLTGHILSKPSSKDWTHLMLPAEYEPSRAFVTSIGWEDPRTEPGELLWEERMGRKEIDSLKADLGSWRAAGQLQQRPEPAGGGIIKREHWQLWPPEGEPTDNLGRVVKPAAYPAMDYILASLDTAFTEKTMNDESALTIWGVFSGDTVTRDLKTSLGSTRVSGEVSARVMLMYCWHGRKELHDLVNEVGKHCKTYKVDKILIENKASGISVAQELRRLFGTEGFSIQLNDPGNVDKLARLYSVQNIFEEQQVYAPERQWSEDVMSQCGTFPNAKHDDIVDTCLTGDTLVRMADGSQRRLDRVVAGDMVDTPDGARCVLWSGQTGVDEIWQLDTSTGTLLGTASHPVFADGGWIPFAKLRPNDTLASWHGNQNLISWSRPEYSTEKPIGGTPTHPSRHIVGTSLDRGNSFTEPCGRNIGEVFQTAITSTIETVTRQTTEFATYVAYLLRTTMLHTQQRGANWAEAPGSYSIWRAYAGRPVSGTAAPRVVSGIGNELSVHYGGLTTLPLSVRSYLSSFRAAGAEVISKLCRSRLDTAQPDVSPAKANTVSVRAVSNTRTIAPVYNLTVEGCEMFYANDVLVHNCSQALRHLRDIGLIVRPAERLQEMNENLRHIGSTPQPLYPS